MKTLRLRSKFSVLSCQVNVWEGRRVITRLSGIGPFPAAPTGLCQFPLGRSLSLSFIHRLRELQKAGQSSASRNLPRLSLERE